MRADGERTFHVVGGLLSGGVPGETACQESLTQIDEMQWRRIVTSLWRSIALVSVCLLVAAGMLAQETGSITGTVRDNTGAVIPNAEVTVSSVAQGVTQRVNTNAGGDYLVAGLPPGSYDLAITSKGFKKFSASGVILRIGQKARADATLEVGEITTAIEVTGEAVAQVETQSSEISGVVTGKEISQIVLNGRNFTQLVTLVPGISNQTGQDEGTVGVYGNVAMSIN